MTNSAYALLLAIKDIINSEVEPILSETVSENPSIDLSSVVSRLDTIITFLNSITPPLYGLFTCDPNFSITSLGQIVPFNTQFGGNLTSNADGSINLPANSEFIVDFEINGVYSVTAQSTYHVYDCDTGSLLLSCVSISENYNTNLDIGEIRNAVISSGPLGRRIGVKVATKQASGTLTLSQYQSFIKLIQV